MTVKSSLVLLVLDPYSSFILDDDGSVYNLCLLKSSLITSFFNIRCNIDEFFGILLHSLLVSAFSAISALSAVSAFSAEKRKEKKRKKDKKDKEKKDGKEKKDKDRSEGKHKDKKDKKDKHRDKNKDQEKSKSSTPNDISQAKGTPVYPWPYI
nr:hypothetical protein [Tanacetum cinerariifolium]